MVRKAKSVSGTKKFKLWKKKNSFKHGNAGIYLTKLAIEYINTNSFNCLEYSTLESEVHQTPMTSVTTVEDQPFSDDHEQYHLRTLSEKQKQLNKVKCVDVHSNRFLNLHKTAILWNTGFKEHLQLFPVCDGELTWDPEGEIKYGMSWTERLKCVKCVYKSEQMKLYDEVRTRKRGRRASTMNIGIQMGLKTTSISNTAMRNILMATNCPPPNRAAMQRQSNKVGERIIELNNENMEDIRQEILTINTESGDGNRIFAEGDARYNNPISSGATPFQAATQVVSTITENVTDRKLCIGLFTGNKLCKTAQHLRHKGNTNITCPDHEGTCTANIQQDCAIGNEAAWTEECVKDVNQSGLHISKFTTDGDSKAYNGLINAQGRRDCENLKDIRHLGCSVKRAVDRAHLSPTLFASATTVATKGMLKRRLGNELKSRCTAELMGAHKHHQGDIDKIIEGMPNTIEAIIECYDNCGELCQTYSYVCSGLCDSEATCIKDERKKWKRVCIPKAHRKTISPDEKDKNELRRCCNVMLNKEALTKTRFLTTQKSEALNRTFTRCNPKSVTWSRNFKSRIHSAVQLSNNGIFKSMKDKCNALGIPLSQEVVHELKKEYGRELYQKRRKRSQGYKARRQFLRNRQFMLHDRVNSKTTYQKGLTDPVVRADHNYNRQDVL